MGDLDLTEFMKDGSGAGPADLDWLDVDEEDYRELDKLPKQNLDISPDLKALWRHQDESASMFVPNTGAPRTMGDLAGKPMRVAPEEIVHVARLAMMRSTDPRSITSALRQRFDSNSLKEAKTALAGALAERGLLGGYYIDAADFPKCAQSGAPAKFVRRYAKGARYLKAKTACESCQHKQILADGSERCGVFHKQVVLEVPYTEEIAEAVEESQRAQGAKVAARSSGLPTDKIAKDAKKALDALDRAQGAAVDAATARAKKALTKLTKAVEGQLKKSEANLAEAEEDLKQYPDTKDRVESHKRSVAKTKKCLDAAKRAGSDHESVRKALAQVYEWARDFGRKHAKARIKQAFLAPRGGAKPTFTGRQQRQKEARLVTKADLEQFQQDAKQQQDDQRATVIARQAQPIVATLRREMLKGRGRTEVIRAIKLAFDKRDLEATKDAWLPVLRQAGLYGAVYIDQPSFDDCRVGADYLAKHSSKVRAVVKGDKCGSCIFNKVGRCLMYGRKLVEAAEDVLTPETVAAVLDEQRIAGNLPTGAEKMAWGKTPAEALRKIHATATRPKGATAGDVRGLVETAFRGAGRTAGTGDLTKRDIVKVAHQYMNEGLYGRDLLRLLKARFEIRDLKAARSELKAALADQGLQGIRFIDPTVYDDYGKGCKTAAAKHRTRAAVKYAKVGSKCHTCVHQSRPGVCSVLNKELVTEPPYVDKAAEQKAILASGPSMEVSPAALINNGVSMITEFQLQQSGNIDLNPAGDAPEVIVEFGAQEIELP